MMQIVSASKAPYESKVYEIDLSPYAEWTRRSVFWIKVYGICCFGNELVMINSLGSLNEIKDVLDNAAFVRYQAYKVENEWVLPPS